MSSTPVPDLAFAPGDPADRLCRRLRALGARPFHQQVVQSPWSVVYDADVLHEEVKARVAEVVDGCGRPDAVRCLTVTAPPGYGKTHVLAWNRQRLERGQEAVFVYVPPYSPDSGPFENHALRAALDSLRLHSPWQTARLNEAVRSLLADAYDGYVASGRPLSKLGKFSFWSRLLRPLTLRVAGRRRDEQFVAFQEAFRQGDLLEFAFPRFAARHPPGPEGLRPDRDAFVAFALLVCGDAAQQHHARQWLQNDPAPPEVWAPYHLRERCQGVDKVRNVLFTLMHLVGRPLCFAFDQFEDTYKAVMKHPDSPWDLLTPLLVRLGSVPRFSLLFFVQDSAWVEFRAKIPPMLHDRITEGFGAQRLRSLDDHAARAVLRARLDTFVWRELAAEGLAPPADQPLFPFTAEEARRLRIEANSELRPFLRLAQSRYEELVLPPPPPSPVIVAVVPARVPPHQSNAVRVHGRHFRPEVEVFLGGLPVTPVTYHPDEGAVEVIEFVAPAGLLGEVEVRVQASDDPRRQALATLTVADSFPTPYWQHVDRVRFRQRRTDRKLTMVKLGELAGLAPARIGTFERGNWNPPDDFIEKLAAALGGTPVDFRKDPSGDVA